MSHCCFIILHDCLSISSINISFSFQMKTTSRNTISCCFTATLCAEVLRKSCVQLVLIMFLLIESSFVMKHNCQNFYFLFQCYAPYHSNITPKYQATLNPELQDLKEGKMKVLQSVGQNLSFLAERSSTLPTMLSAFIFISSSITSNFLTAPMSHARMLKDGVNL